MRKGSFSQWLTYNIIIPLSPVFIKLVISVFGDTTKIVVNVLDSTELLYYNFVICVIFMYNITQKQEKTRAEYWMEIGAVVVIILDIILLMLVYGKQQSSGKVHVASIIISVLVPIVVAVHKQSMEGSR